MRPVPRQLARLAPARGRTPIHQRTPAWEIDGWIVPEDASGGGDFVMTQSTADSIRVWMCDVTGHGRGAAAASARVRRILRPFVQAPITLRNLCRANELVFRALQGDRFVCVTAIELATRGGRAIVANSGNPMLLLHRRGAERIDRFSSTGMPLGLIDPAEWRPPTFALTYLKPGDRFACFTDGVSDELARGSKPGLKRIVRSLLRPHGSPANEIAFRMTTATQTSAAQTGAGHDDMTVVTITAAQPGAATPRRLFIR
jgi:serine phosphatase RsbU (regulator of sigma subunit)